VYQKGRNPVSERDPRAASEDSWSSIVSILVAIVGGGLLGALIGGVIGGLTYEGCTDPGCWDFGRGLNEWAGAFIGLLIGAVVGLILWLLWRWLP
jgi:Na+/proline symporter